MVRGILRFINKEVDGLHQAAYLLGLFAFFSQILGLIRDRFLAHFFGASQALDIYYAAFRIPDLIFVSVASTVSIFVLIPFLTERMKEGTAREFISNITSTFFSIISLVSLATFFLTPVLATIFFPQFQGEIRETYIKITRIMLISPIILGLSNLLASVTQIKKKFFVYALSPLLYNVGIIIGILFIYPKFGLTGLALGVVLGALLHLLIQIPAVIESKLLPKLFFKPNFREFFNVLKISLPRTLTLASNNLALLMLISLASKVSEGSISIFNFSFVLQSVPLSIIGVSYSVAAFPTLAKFYTEGDKIKFVHHITVATKHIIFWSIPAIFLLIVLRAQIVRTILGSGEFSWADTRLTAAALALFGFSVLAQSLVLLFVRGYYAAGRTKTPLIINILSSGLIIALAFALLNIFHSNVFFKDFFESLLRIDFIEGTAVIMLPLAYSVGMTINAILLWFFFTKEFEEFTISIKEAFFDSLAASFLMAFTAFQFLKVFAQIFDQETFFGIFLQGFLSGSIGIIFGVITLFLLKNKEIEVIYKSLHAKFRRPNILGGEQESL